MPPVTGSAMSDFLDTSIEGSKDPSDVFYINCENYSEGRNARFKYVEGPTRRKVMAFAIKDIKKKDEIFASYG